MRVHESEGQTLYVEEDDGRTILRVTVSRMTMMTNAYAVEVFAPQGEGEPVTHELMAVSTPLPWPPPAMRPGLIKAGWTPPQEPEL